jgi:hypothetical protein
VPALVVRERGLADAVEREHADPGFLTEVVWRLGHPRLEPGIGEPPLEHVEQAGGIAVVGLDVVGGE